MQASAQVRAMVRSAWKTALGTVSCDGGHPHVSLVASATAASGAPLLLLSELAVHTRNLQTDQRASLLFDETLSGPDILTGARATLNGRIERCDCVDARRRYLARHPGAAAYIDFGDFQIYRMAVEAVHLVAGFGRIVQLDGAAATIDLDGAESLLAAEPDILAHMNQDHADALVLMAEQAAGGRSARRSARWRLSGCDPEGIDLVAEDRAARLCFPHRITTPQAARKALIDMVSLARKRDPGGSDQGQG